MKAELNQDRKFCKACISLNSVRGFCSEARGFGGRKITAGVCRTFEANNLSLTAAETDFNF